MVSTILKLTISLLIVSSIQADIQELWLYESYDYNGDNTYSGNHLYFTSNLPDTSNYPLGLVNHEYRVNRWCARGMWSMYAYPNYETAIYVAGDEDVSKVVCYGGPFAYKSFRHWGANETTTNLLTLYSGKWMAGTEYPITKKAHSGISQPIQSFVMTGNTSWLLFEGQNVDGKSVCLESPSQGSHFVYKETLSKYNISTVGSVFQTCDFKMLKGLESRL